MCVKQERYIFTYCNSLTHFSLGKEFQTKGLWSYPGKKHYKYSWHHLLLTRQLLEYYLNRSRLEHRNARTHLGCGLTLNYTAERSFTIHGSIKSPIMNFNIAHWNVMHLSLDIVNNEYFSQHEGGYVGQSVMWCIIEMLLFHSTLFLT